MFLCQVQLDSKFDCLGSVCVDFILAIPTPKSTSAFAHPASSVETVKPATTTPLVRRSIVDNVETRKADLKAQALALKAKVQMQLDTDKEARPTAAPTPSVKSSSKNKEFPTIEEMAKFIK